MICVQRRRATVEVIGVSVSARESKAEQLEATIAELDLEPYIEELDEQGYTIVPPSITGVSTAQFDELTQLLLDESERLVGCKFTVKDGPECELDYGDFEGVLEKQSGVKPSQFGLEQLCNIHRAFRDLAVNPAGTALVHHMVGLWDSPPFGYENWAARFSSFNGVIKETGGGYGESLGLHCDQAVPLPWPDEALNANCTWALTEYTREDGALACVPGSHRRKCRPGPDAAKEAIAVECPRGSMIALHGALWHGAYPKSTCGLRVTIANYFRHASLSPQDDIPNHFPQELADDCADPKTFKLLAGFGNPYQTFPSPYPRAIRPESQSSGAGTRQR